jgi:hypothetical protein
MSSKDKRTLADLLRAEGYGEDDIAAIPPGIAASTEDAAEGPVTLTENGWR